MKKLGLVCVLLMAAMGVYAEARFYFDANLGIESTTLKGEQDRDATGFTTDLAMGNVLLPALGIGIAGLVGASGYFDTSTADGLSISDDLTRLRFGLKIFCAPLRSVQLFAAPYYVIADGHVGSTEIANAKGFGFDAGISFFPIRKFACSPSLNASYRYNSFDDLRSHSAVFTVGFVKR